MTFTNLRKHALVGFAAGFCGSLLALNLLPFMDKIAGQPTPQNKLTTLLGALAFFLVTLGWELIQYLSTRRRFYASRHQLIPFPFRWKDTLADIIVGNLAFLLPWIVITLGTYGGNLLRP